MLSGPSSHPDDEENKKKFLLNLLSHIIIGHEKS